MLSKMTMTGKCKTIIGSAEDTDSFENNFNKWSSDNTHIEISEIKCVSESGAKKIIALVFYNEIKSKPKTQIPTLPDDKMPLCPKCDGKMVIRANGTTGDLFFGCKKFPECKGMRSFDQEHWDVITDGKDPGPAPNFDPKDDDIPF